MSQIGSHTVVSDLAGTSLLLVTGINFWNTSAGNGVRIHGVVTALKRRGVRIHLLFDGQLSPSERTSIERMGLESVVIPSDYALSETEQKKTREVQTPVTQLRDRTPFVLRKLIRRIRHPYYLAVHRLKRIRENLSKRLFPPPGKLAADMQDAVNMPLFGSLHLRAKELKPDVVLVEYVHYAYLLEALHGIPKPVTVIDTHDVLHQLLQEFKEHTGRMDWQVSRRDERRALKDFDIIVAIQAEDAKVFKRMLPFKKVVTCLPPFEVAEDYSDLPFANRLVFLGSSSEANSKGLRDFLEYCWMKIHSRFYETELHIYGNVCKAFEGEKWPNVHFNGFVDDVAEAYRNSDLVISPITFGGGIKIKVLEAMAHGRPLVLCAHSARGVIGIESAGLPVVDSWDAFTRTLIDFLDRPERLAELGARAREAIQENYGYDSASEPLARAIAGRLKRLRLFGR